MTARNIEEVAFADARKANNGPRKPKKIVDKLVCIDPGTQRMGVAVFSNSYLEVSGVIVPDAKLQIAWRVQQIPMLLADWLGRHTSLSGRMFDVLVEFPEVYATGRKVNPRDVLWIAASVGAALAAIPTARRVYDENPKDWKANLRKENGNANTFEALFPKEKALLHTKRPGLPREVASSYDDNELDAIGMGLHFLERMR
jgi:hypothetical protein